MQESAGTLPRKDKRESWGGLPDAPCRSSVQIPSRGCQVSARAGAHHRPRTPRRSWAGCSQIQPASALQTSDGQLAGQGSVSSVGSEGSKGSMSQLRAGRTTKSGGSHVAAPRGTKEAKERYGACVPVCACVCVRACVWRDVRLPRRAADSKAGSACRCWRCRLRSTAGGMILRRSSCTGTSVAGGQEVRSSRAALRRHGGGGSEALHLSPVWRQPMAEVMIGGVGVYGEGRGSGYYTSEGGSPLAIVRCI